MRFLRTNTAVRLTVGPFLDKTDGVTPEVALTVTSCHLTLTVDDANVPTLVLDAAATASGGNNDMVHITNDNAGFYDLELTAANLNYVGRAMLAITDAATHCPVFHEFMILPAMVYDSLVLGTDTIQADVTQLLGTAWLTPGTAGTPDVNVKLISGDSGAADNAEAFFDGTGYAGTNNVIPTVTTLTNLPTIPNNWLTAAGINADAFTAAKFADDCFVADNFGDDCFVAANFGDGFIVAASFAANAITDAAVASDVTIASVTGAVGSVTGNVGGNVAGSVASVTARVTANVDQINGTSIAGTGSRVADAFVVMFNVASPVLTTASVNQTGDSYARLGAPAGASVSADVAAVKTDTGNLVTRITSTLFSGITSLASWLGALAGKAADSGTQTEIRATTAGAGYTITTDSLEAIRDRGDAAWITATGFSTHTAADVWAVATRVLTAGTNIQLPSNGLANVSSWTVDITGSLSGSVGSVTGNVGGNVAGSVASVTGNLGGNVTGSIGSLAAQAKADVNAEADTALADVGVTLARMGALTDWIDGGRLDLLLDAVKAKTDLIGTTSMLVTDSITAAAISAAAANKIADHNRRRTQANVEASSNGDTLDLSSEYGFIQQAQKSSVSGGTLTVKKTDGSTTLGTKTVTGSSSADPITGVS